jgi:hypothetical protein
MSLAEIERAKREAMRAKGRLDTTLAALQARLRPSSLAEDAWGGVKDKSADLAEDALEAVKKRPAAVSAALGAIVLFVVRDPLKRAVGRLISGKRRKKQADGIDDAGSSVEDHHRDRVEQE